MGALTRSLDRNLYPDHAANWDDEYLRSAVLARLQSDMVILDLGAGAGRVEQMNFRGTARKVVGLDPDPRVRDNPFLDEAHVGMSDHLPFPDECFDLVVCDNVLEHLESPESTLNEVARVLRPGGRFIAKTPNRAHYMPMVARLTPLKFHKFVNRLRGRRAEDTFPTRYRMNSRSAVRRCAERSGLKVDSIRLIEGRPEYLRFNALTYLGGWLYERFVNSNELFAGLRIVLLMELRKPEAK